jgi:type IV secretory pathway component VirB8
MEQKLTEAKAENNEEAIEYLGFIKSSVEDGSYFKDGLNWYFFRYVTPICDRTLLIFGAIIASVVLYCLVQMVRSAFPLVEEVPVFLAAADTSVSFPNLVNLKPRKDSPGYDQNILTVDEAVAKYLLEIYVKDRESYDFSKAEVEEVNRKFNRIRTLSSAEEYRVFQLIMSRDNPASPLNNFGQNIRRDVKIESVKLVRKEVVGFANQAKEFLQNVLPSEAEVRFIATTKTTDANEVTKDESERYITKISFDFAGAQKDKKKDLGFAVKGYKLYKIK